METVETADTTYQHKHGTYMHKACYDAGTPCVPPIYGDAQERWELWGDGVTTGELHAGWSTAAKEMCARCDGRIIEKQAVVRYTYWWNS